MDNDNDILAFIDNFPQDCADYFASAVERTWKEVEASVEMATDWRFLCRIHIPKEFEREVALEHFCFELQTKMLYELHILTAFIIEREDHE